MRSVAVPPPLIPAGPDCRRDDRAAIARSQLVGGPGRGVRPGRMLESQRTMSGSASPLVGIVVVSHSSRLAEGVVELAAQMADPGLALSAVGGTADGRLGTDATRIAATIRSADSGAGVVVVADLGSAILATEAAIETLDPELASRVRISGGPIAEGAVVAAVQASIGDSLADVLRSAESAAQLDKGVSR